MATKLTWIGITMFLTACAGGDGDDDDGMAADSSGSVGDSSSSDGASSMTTMTATTAPTTAETLSTTDTATTDDESSTDASGSEGSSGDTGTGELSCSAYCDTYATSCVDHTEYANEQDCLDNCAQWPEGAAADTAVDTLGCRIYHATVAGSTNPDVHCPHAGPSGSGMCVAAEAPTCDVYCMRYFENCEGGLNAFDDEAQCMSECATWYAGTFKDTEGHTIGCHSYHANAALGNPDTHCPHAGPGGGGICVL